MDIWSPTSFGFAHQILESFSTAAYICDKNGFITMYNNAAVSLWGRTPLPGEDRWTGAWRLYHAKDRTELTADDLYKINSSQNNLPVEFIVEKPDGRRSIVIQTCKPIVDEGNVEGSIYFLDDILSQQKEAHMAAIVETSDDAIISKTLSGIVTSWNKAAERIFGYKAEEMIGQAIYKLIPEYLWKEETAIQEQLRNAIRIDHYETIRVTKYNKLINVSLSISPIEDKEGNVIGASKIARDITAQKLHENALRESEERLRLAVETARIGTWACTLRSGEMVCSAETNNIFGVEDKQLNWQMMTAMIHAGDKGMVQANFNAVFNFENKADYDTEFRIIPFNKGVFKWVRMRGKVYFAENRQPERFIGTVLDITDEKMTKELLEQTVELRTQELQRLNEHLLKSNADLEQFAYIASHDLQEPLRKIQTFIDIIEKEQSPVKVKQYFDRIKESAQRMSSLIKSVLDYSRLERSEMQFTRVDLNTVLDDAVKDFDVLISATSAHIEREQLPVITALPTQLRQLFSNLLSNALKFCDKQPQITVSSRIVERSEAETKITGSGAGHFVEIIFADNGIGFEQQFADKVFQIFQKLHPSAVYKGTGIGLSLCKKIVENHHGHISVQSEPGKGTTFFILLPIEDEMPGNGHMQQRLSL